MRNEKDFDLILEEEQEILELLKQMELENEIQFEEDLEFRSMFNLYESGVKWWK